MKVLLVWPNKEGFGVKPIGLSIISAVAKRDGHDVRLFDTSFMNVGGHDYKKTLTDAGVFKPVDYGCDVSKRDVDIEHEIATLVNGWRPDVIGISALTDELPLANRIARTAGVASGWSARIIIGGKGAFSGTDNLVDEKLFLYNQVYPGEVYDNSWITGEVRDMVNVGITEDLDSLPYLDWSIFNDRHFLRPFDGRLYRGGDYMITWGCPGHCSYCINSSWTDTYGNRMRYHGILRVVDELQFLASTWGVNFWKYHDEDFLAKPMGYLDQLCNALRNEIAAPFTCMANARSVTESKAGLLKYAGCASVSLGFESGNDVIRRMLGRRESRNDIVTAVRILREAGIRTSSFNMIGLPFEGIAEIVQTIELNRDAAPDCPNVSIYQPLPHTALYDTAVRHDLYDPDAPLDSNVSALRKGVPNEKLQTIVKNWHTYCTEPDADWESHREELLK